MTPSNFRIGTVPRTVTAVSCGFELRVDTEFFVNANYFGKVLLDIISNCFAVWSDLIYWQRPPMKPPYQWTAYFHIKFSKMLTKYPFLLLNDTVLTWLLEPGPIAVHLIISFVKNKKKRIFFSKFAFSNYIILIYEKRKKSPYLT